MEGQRVECLRCGHARELAARFRRLSADDCPRCGYLGWAPSALLDELTRKALRERSLESRRLRAVA